jgi:hypothetical protein
MNAEGKQFLKEACADARKWANKYDSLAEAWNKCERADWMCWALNKLEYDDPVALRRFACLVRSEYAVSGWAESLGSAYRREKQAGG